MDVSEPQLVVPGTILTDTVNFMRGHGTYIDGNKSVLKASVAGSIVKVDRLLCVEPVENARFLGEVGHVVIGRVLKVDQTRWIVDIQSRLDAFLPLSSVNLPGGETRRRVEDDERNMRQYLKVRKISIVSCELIKEKEKKAIKNIFQISFRTNGYPSFG